MIPKGNTMSKERLVGIQLTIPEANRVVKMLYDHNDSGDVIDVIREIEMAIDDALLEAEDEQEGE